MVKFDASMKDTYRTLAVLLVVLNTLMLSNLDLVVARDKGDDIILTKGKLIMRGGKGKGNLILDTGSKQSEGHHEMMPMMPMMNHHFNPFSFYPMQHQHQHQPMVVHPIYLEDHSAMHQHHHSQPEQHHEYQQHHEPHYQHHEVEYQHHHEEPHHEEPHHESHQMHHYQPHHMEMQHHEPMGHHYEHGGHQEEEEGHYGGHETHPMLQFMMQGGSGLQPAYQQLAAMQAIEQPRIYAHELQTHPQDLDSINNHMQQQQQQYQLQQQHLQAQSAQKAPDVEGSSTNNKQVKQSSSLISQAANNPLAAIIKPLFSGTLLSKQKKP